MTRIEYEMTEKNNGVRPSIPELVKQTHTKPDGTYVDKKAKEIVEDVYNLATQMSPHDSDDNEGDSSAVSPPSSTLLNKVFCEQVPVVKGYRFGIGSVHHHRGEALQSSTPCPSRQNHLETEFAEMKTTVSSLGDQVATLSGKFDTLQASLNILVQTITRMPTTITTPVDQP